MPDGGRLAADGPARGTRPLDRSLFDEVIVLALRLRRRFRRIGVREIVLLRSGDRWREWSPFVEYPDAEAARWLRASLEPDEPPRRRDSVPVNVTVPVLDPPAAAELVIASGCRTAKVKVADPRSDPAADLSRLRAVRQALGPTGGLRVDANGAWSVSQAERLLTEWAELDLDYAEQPCAGVEELAELRERLSDRVTPVRIAADESIRRAADPLRVRELGAADVAVLKHQPLGGWRRCLGLGERLGLPVVLSSALESSVGLRMGLQTACALPGPELACGLDTARLLADDVLAESLTARQGRLHLGAPPEPDPAVLRRLRAPAGRCAWWLARLDRCLALVPGGEEE